MNNQSDPLTGKMGFAPSPVAVRGAVHPSAGFEKAAWKAILQSDGANFWLYRPKGVTFAEAMQPGHLNFAPGLSVGDVVLVTARDTGGGLAATWTIFAGHTETQIDCHLVGSGEKLAPSKFSDRALTPFALPAEAPKGKGLFKR